MSDNEMKLTYSAVVTADGGPMVSVCFERGSDTAEGKLPDCRILSSTGFTAEEVTALEEYLQGNKDDLMETARKISGIKHLMS
jgi:hypothetical protein